MATKRQIKNSIKHTERLIDTARNAITYRRGLLLIAEQVYKHMQNDPLDPDEMVWMRSHLHDLLDWIVHPLDWTEVVGETEPLTDEELMNAVRKVVNG